MKIDWPALRHALATGWFYARSHFTKALGLAAVIIGYALQHQTEWITWLSNKPRGVATRWIGYATVLLGLYNQFFPPAKPPTPGATP